MLCEDVCEICIPFRLANARQFVEVENAFAEMHFTELSEDKSKMEEPPPMTGFDAIRRLHSGTRVVRGPDWKWGDQVPV